VTHDEADAADGEDGEDRASGPASMKPWLDDDELIDLTGYRRPSYQMRWLAEHGIKCSLNGLRKVRVMRDAVAGLPGRAAERRRTEPDFSKVRRAG